MKKVLMGILIILCFILAGYYSEIKNTSESSEKSMIETSGATEAPNTEVESEISEVREESTGESAILAFVDAFNATSEEKLVFAEDFTPSDKTNSHYRTEFRLGAYSDAIGKSYTFGGAVVDIVGRSSWSDEVVIRVYMTGATVDQRVEMVKYASPIMDPDIDFSELQETIDYISENKTVNGYYYADLGLLIFGDEFMLKMGND